LRGVRRRGCKRGQTVIESEGEERVRGRKREIE
jgi:hypothetical protein